MNISAEDFRRHYSELSDEALLEVDPTELVPVAQTCHAEEVARRGLDTPLEAVPEVAPEEDSHEPEAEEMVCITEYDYVDEGELAQGLLASAEISARLEHEPGVTRLMVPKSLAEQALQLLVTPLSDEELEAQAEAAAAEGEEAEGEEAE